MSRAYAYVIGPEDGPQKVGISHYVQNALMGCQRGNHRRLHAHAAIEMPSREAKLVEDYAHFLLADRHILNEWFAVTPEDATAAIKEAIAAVRSGRRASLSATVKAGRSRRSPARRKAEPSCPVRALLIRRAAEVGISLNELSKAIGCSNTYLSQFIKRSVPRTLPDEKRTAIAVILSLDPEQLRLKTEPRRTWNQRLYLVGSGGPYKQLDVA